VWAVGTVVILFVLWSLIFPEIAWTGAAWLTIDARVTDTATKKPISNATVTLVPDPPAHIDERISSPTVLTAQTDSRGRAVLKHMFGAGGGSHSTTIVVRSSLVRCEAPGYSPSEVRLTQADKIRFRDFPFFAPRNHRTDLSVELSPQ
jgi:hypothetical protein